MKVKLISPILIILMICCNRAQQEDRTTEEPVMEIDVNTESSIVYDPSKAIWSYDFNPDTDQFEITRLRSVEKDNLKGETLERIINQTWPRVQIKFIRTSNDTAFISIPESEVLTQQMGTAGAESFMISTTFTFTELNGIEFVSFDFEEGDHAIPGVYNRNSWNGGKNQ